MLRWMPHKDIHVGDRFGLLVVGGAPFYEPAHWRVAVSCDCGSDLFVTRIERLRSGKTKSCGCNKFVQKHGYMTKHSPKEHQLIYRVWRAMLSRCENPNATAYADYGGRGIVVCERWHTFTNFIADMGHRPAGFQIERRDNARGYEPDNCYWADRITQANNRRSRRRDKFEPHEIDQVRWLVSDGCSQVDVARFFGVHWNTIHKIVKQGQA